MPSRLLRESILDSDAVNSLSLGGEVFYRRLMSVVDDFGRFDGRPAVLRGRLYPLRLDTVSEADIVEWLCECRQAGLVAFYTVDGRTYIQFHKLGAPRAKESKYPPPPDSAQMQTGENGCKRMQTGANGCNSSSFEMPGSQLTSVNGCAQTRADVPYSYSGSDSYSGSGAPPLPPTGGREGGGGEYKSKPADEDQYDPGKPAEARPRSPVGFADAPDPVVAEAEVVKRFAAAWASAGLGGLIDGRLSVTLRGMLLGNLSDPDWAAQWEEAVRLAGGRAFLRDGVGRRVGRLDVGEFLRKPDLAREIINGLGQPAPFPAAKPAYESPAQKIMRERAEKRAKGGAA